MFGKDALPPLLQPLPENEPASSAKGRTYEDRHKRKSHNRAQCVPEMIRAYRPIQNESQYQRSRTSNGYNQQSPPRSERGSGYEGSPDKHREKHTQTPQCE